MGGVTLTVPEDYTDIDPAFKAGETIVPVSYTHLDVYKRQIHTSGSVFFSISYSTDTTPTILVENPFSA